MVGSIIKLAVKGFGKALKKKKKSLKELRDEDTFGSGPRLVEGSSYMNPLTGRKTKFKRRKKLKTKKFLRKSRDIPR